MCGRRLCLPVFMYVEFLAEERGAFAEQVRIGYDYQCKVKRA
jgi:hypothetical protein